MDWSRNRVKTTGRTLRDGEMSEELIKEDEQLISYAWRYYCTEVAGIWTGSLSAYQAYPGKSGVESKYVSGRHVFSGGVWFPTALIVPRMFLELQGTFTNVIQENSAAAEAYPIWKAGG